MKAKSKAKILNSLIISVGITTLITTIIPYLKNCSTSKKDSKFSKQILKVNENNNNNNNITNKNENEINIFKKDTTEMFSNNIVLPLINLNKQANNLAVSLDKLDNLDSLFEKEVENNNLISLSSELNSKIKTLGYTEKDFQNVEYEKNKKVLLPETLDLKILTKNKNEILNKAKEIAFNKINNLKEIEYIKEKNDDEIKEAKSINELKKIINKNENKSNFLVSLKDSIYYSKSAKLKINNEFKQKSSENEILEYVNNYHSITDYKKQFYDTEFDLNSNNDKAISYFAKKNFFDATDKDQTNKIQKDFKETIDLKKELFLYLQKIMNRAKDMADSEWGQFFGYFWWEGLHWRQQSLFETFSLFSGLSDTYGQVFWISNFLYEKKDIKNFLNFLKTIYDEFLTNLNWTKEDLETKFETHDFELKPILAKKWVLLYEEIMSKTNMSRFNKINQHWLFFRVWNGFDAPDTRGEEWDPRLKDLYIKTGKNLWIYGYNHENLDLYGTDRNFDYFKNNINFDSNIKNKIVQSPENYNFWYESPDPRELLNIDEFEGKKIYVNNSINTETNKLIQNPFFIYKTFKNPLTNLIDPLKFETLEKDRIKNDNLPKSLVSFFIYNFRNRFLIDKENLSDPNHYFLATEIMRKLFLNINNKYTIEEYNDYFEHHFPNNFEEHKAKAIKRDYYLTNLVSDTEFTMEKFTKEAVLMEYLNLVFKTEKKEDVEKNISKFLEVLDNEIEKSN
ncbi:hypothetical protein [Metamycoplasma canadense]|uniref:Uncharacterized protein n=1 Tax=Metamycoplasma canadense TaxID=29554 RepID=A0A077L6F1_9BACT|nr:hypothetical protein [Metamycoplasma canadense]BAP39386.1 hypothetical protein MCAN360_0112 [Metamycoplasma canadense]